jgi:hypothetical protein
VAAVHALLGKATIRDDDLAAIRVNDFGTHFAITVNDKTRDYADTARDCSQRARVAAVFVALTLAPPDIADLDEPQAATSPTSRTEAPPPSTPESKPAPVRSPSAPEPSAADLPAHEVSAHLELGAKAAYDPGHDQNNLGVHARVAATVVGWGASLGADVPARGSFQLDGVRVQQSRYTTDVSARRVWIHHPLEVRLDAGPTLTWLQLRQADSPTAERVTRWLPGLRLGAALLFARHTISPFFGVDVHCLPFRIPIIVEPEGTIGHTSAVWIGVTLGIAIATH